MTEVADTTKQVGQGLTQKTFSYEPLDALVDIVTNAAGKLSFWPIVWFITDDVCRPSRFSRRTEEEW
jgi:hypothetical protein